MAGGPVRSEGNSKQARSFAPLRKTMASGCVRSEGQATVQVLRFA